MTKDEHEYNIHMLMYTILSRINATGSNSAGKMLPVDIADLLLPAVMGYCGEHAKDPRDFGMCEHFEGMCPANCNGPAYCSRLKDENAGHTETLHGEED